jgi:hypothetical protein
VTTSSGKPPFDEKAPDSSWGAGGDSPKGPDSSSGDPPTQRQPSVPAEPPAEGEPPIYGAGVPYGGDDRTEEIDPIAIDMPFNLDDRKTPRVPAPVATPPAPPPAALMTPRAPVASTLRDFDMAAPAKQLMLSDLFDSTPSSSMSPPDPAAFTSNRPPPQERQREPVKPPGRDVVVAMPSIDIGSEPRVSRLEQPEPAGRAPIPSSISGSSLRAVMPEQVPLPTAPPPHEASPSTPVRVDPTPAERSTAEAASGAVPVPASISADAVQAEEAAAPVEPPSAEAVPAAVPAEPVSAEAIRAAVPAEEGVDEDEPRRRSVPTLDSVGNAAARATPSSPAVGAKAPSAPGAARDFAGGLVAPSSSPHPPPFDSEPPSEVPRFPSEVPTSRPPDVVPYPALLSPRAGPLEGPLDAGPQRKSGQSIPAHERPTPSSPISSLGPGFSVRPEPRGSRDVQSTVTAPAASQAGKAQSNLPSIMLADDVEAEPDSSARRAQRASRATVRLELPPGFGRPGSPTGGPSAPPASSHRPVAPAYSGVGTALELGVPWFANPKIRRLLAAGLVTFLLIVGFVVLLSPRTGSLVVTALAPGNRAVDDVSIFIDGKPLCDVSPCRIKGLSPGMHTLRASAPNLASQAEETVEISAGDEATYNIDLLAVAPEVRSGGLRIAAAEVPLTLYVDGKRVGKLPQEVSGLSSGKHWIKLDPEDESPPIEKSVNVLAGEMVDVEPRAAKRDKALVTIRLSRGSEGALVTFDDAFLLDFPAELELEPNTVHSLTATKPGYEDLSMEVKLDANETEKLIELSLSPAEGTAAEGNAPARKARSKPARKTATKAATAPASTALADMTQGLLNISSVPPSQIILNGRPLGSTPKTGITVPGDSLQTIVFVHPKMGRRRAQKFVPAGKERTVSIRF